MANYLLTQTGEEVQGILNQAPETEAGLQQEVTNREQADTAEQQAREQAIAAEATAREQAIAAEATAREQAVSAEATARADADDALDTKIDAETTRAEGAEGTLDDKIDQEVTDRTAAVTAEATARQQADTAQQQALAQETSRAQQAELANAQAISTNAQALQAEANTRQNADTVLQDHIDDEEERAKAAEATLQANIDAVGQTGGAAVAAERERAQAAESTLDTKIESETDRAEDAEQTLTDAIAKEVTDRTAAVSAEATARADADAALQTAINGKQDTISDLADIRSGAAAGATAYQKPTTGIPATDMSAGVQTSLDKADSALQEHQSLADYYTKSEVDSLITTPDQEYVSVTATAQTTAVTDVLPATGAADTIYRVGNWDGTQYDPTMYALFAWNGSAYVCLAVRSFVGEVYDVSVNHPDGQGNPTPYADLTAALGTDGANIPADIRRGGMSIKFIQGTVQSSDNKYVQYRLMSDSWSIDTNDWAFDGDDTLVENPEYIKAEIDAVGHLLFWIKADGSIDWAIGVPTPVKEYVDSCISEIRNGNEGTAIDGLNKIIAFLDGFSTTNTLAALLNGKVNTETGKSLIQSDVAENIQFVENKEWMNVELDNENKVLGGRKNDGTKVENMSISTPVCDILFVDNPEWTEAKTDKNGHILEGTKKDGSKDFYCEARFHKGIKGNIDKIEGLKDVITTESSKIINQGELFTIENKLRLFDSMICIGDSATDGHIFWRTKGTIVSRKYSYPTQLSKLFPEMTIENAGFAGISAEGWNKTKFSQYDFTNYGVAVIELGYNGGISNTFDTDVAPYGNDYSQYADTSMGNYCQLIKKIQSTNPYIFIILVSSKSATGETKLAIKSVADEFELPLLDLSDTILYPINFEDANMPLNNTPAVHSSPWGYLLKANYMQLGIGRAIDEFYERAITCVFGQNDWIWKITCEILDPSKGTVNTPYVEVMTCFTGTISCSVNEGESFEGWYYDNNGNEVLLSSEEIFTFDPFAYPGVFRYETPKPITIIAKIL